MEVFKNFRLFSLNLAVLTQAFKTSYARQIEKVAKLAATQNTQSLYKNSLWILSRSPTKKYVASKTLKITQSPIETRLNFEKFL